jgi:hypothetical protein
MEDRRKNYRHWDFEQNRERSVSPQVASPENDLVFFVSDLIRQLDLSAFHSHYASGDAWPAALRCQNDSDAFDLRLQRGCLLESQDRSGLRTQFGVHCHRG